MDFKDYVINEEDFDFFQSLSKEEKLLFMYDLICEEIYGAGSIDQAEVIEIKLDRAEAIKDFIDQIEHKMRSFIASTIRLDVDCNVVFMNNSVIINSNKKKEMTAAVEDLYMEGYLLKELKMTDKMSLVFHHQKYCKMYEVIGLEESISLN